MPKFKVPFKVEDHNPENSGSKEVLPPGEHVMTISKILEYDPEKDIDVFFRIVLQPFDMGYRDVILTVFFRYDGVPNHLACEFSQNRFAQLLQALGMDECEDTDDLVSLTVVMSCAKHKEEPEKYVEILNFKPVPTKVAKPKTKQPEVGGDDGRPF